MGSPGSMPFQNSSMLQLSALATAKRLPAEILLAPSSHFFNCDQETPTAFASPLLDTPENSRMRRMFEPMITSTSLAGLMLFMASLPLPPIITLGVGWVSSHLLHWSNGSPDWVIDNIKLLC